MVLDQVWAVHSKSVVAVALLALLFRLTSKLLRRALLKYFPRPDEAAIATYRVVGLLHHTIQVPLATLVLADQRLWHDRLFGATPLSTVVLVISSAYFLHDFISCVENVATQGVSYVIHGAGCASVFMFSLFHVPSMLHFYGAGFLMWEISSFAVHFRWFLFKRNASKTLQNINGVVLLLTFFFARIVWGYYLSYLVVSDLLAYKQASQVLVYITLAANISLNALNTYWFWLIMGKAVAAATGSKGDELGKRD